MKKQRASRSGAYELATIRSERSIDSCGESPLLPSLCTNYNVLSTLSHRRRSPKWKPHNSFKTITKYLFPPTDYFLSGNSVTTLAKFMRQDSLCPQSSAEDAPASHSGLAQRICNRRNSNVSVGIALHSLLGYHKTLRLLVDSS